MEFPLLNPGIKRLVRYIVPYKWLVAGAVLCMVIAGASSSLIATLLGKLTDLGFISKQLGLYWLRQLVSFWLRSATVGVCS